MSDSTTSGTRVIRNTVVNTASGFINALLVLVLTPVFLNELGSAQYGVWLIAVVFTLTQGFGLADLGLRQTGVRFVADARGRGTVERISDAVSTLIAIFSVVGVVAAAALVVFTPTLISAFGIEDDLRDEARWVFVLVAIQLPIDMLASAYQAVIEGYERYLHVRIAVVGTRIVWGVAAIIAVLLGGDVVIVALISAIAAAGGLVFSIVAARWSYAELRPRRSLVTRAMLRELGSFGASFTILRVASVVYNQMDKLIIGAFIAASAVALYDVPYRVHAIAVLVLSLPPSALMPASALLGAQDDRRRLRELYLRGTRLAMGLGLPVTLGVLVLAEPVVVAWVGEEFRHLADETRVFLIYPLLAVFHNVAAAMLSGIGRLRELILLGTIPITLNLVLSLILVDRYGIGGVIWATQVSFAAAWLPYLIVSFRTFGVTLRDWWRSVVRPNLLGPALQVAVGLALLQALDADTPRLVVLMALGLNVAVGVGIFVLVGLPREELRKITGSLGLGAR